jgi:hypothetical protein
MLRSFLSDYGSKSIGVRVVLVEVVLLTDKLNTRAWPCMRKGSSSLQRSFHTGRNFVDSEVAIHLDICSTWVSMRFFTARITKRAGYFKRHYLKSCMDIQIFQSIGLSLMLDITL